MLNLAHLAASATAQWKRAAPSNVRGQTLRGSVVLELCIDQVVSLFTPDVQHQLLRKHAAAIMKSWNTPCIFNKLTWRCSHYLHNDCFYSTEHALLIILESYHQFSASYRVSSYLKTGKTSLIKEPEIYQILQVKKKKNPLNIFLQFSPHHNYLNELIFLICCGCKFCFDDRRWSPVLTHSGCFNGWLACDDFPFDKSMLQMICLLSVIEEDHRDTLSERLTLQLESRDHGDGASEEKFFSRFLTEWRGWCIHYFLTTGGTLRML